MSEWNPCDLQEATGTSKGHVIVGAKDSSGIPLKCQNRELSQIKSVVFVLRQSVSRDDVISCRLPYRSGSYDTCRKYGSVISYVK